MVDTDILISLMYERKPLWDVQSKNCHNRDVARKRWFEIAEELKSISKFFYMVMLYFTLVIMGVSIT